MTVQQTDTAAPPQPPSTAQQLLHAAEVLALERAAIRAVTGPLRAQLVAVQRATVRAWIAAFGSLDAPGDPIRVAAIATQVRGDLARIDVAASVPLDGYVRRALGLGIEQAAKTTGIPMTADGIGAVLNAPTIRTVAELDQNIQQRIDDADAAIGQAAGGTFADLDAALGRAHRAVGVATRDTVTAVNGGANAGQAAAADFLGADLLWIAEPDACVTCLGFAGRLASAGQPFDPAFAGTFTAKPHIWPPGPIDQPPLHPHCRCRCEPWLGAGPGASGPPLPQVLQREARRSVYKGWSLPSESQPERIRAARILLARNTIAPASVKDYSRRAVKAGRFPTRTVPRYTKPPAKTKP